MTKRIASSTFAAVDTLIISYFIPGASEAGMTILIGLQTIVWLWVRK